MSFENPWQSFTHFPLVPIYVSVNWVSIGSSNGLSPVWRQASIWTNDGLLLIGPLGANLGEIQIKMLKFSFMKMHLNLWNGNHFFPGGYELKLDEMEKKSNRKLYTGMI